MRKLKEVHIAESCFNKAKPHELIFVLLGRDVAAPAAIRAWVAERLRLGKNVDGDPQLTEAKVLAENMERERAHGLDHEALQGGRTSREQAEDVSILPAVAAAFSKFVDEPTARNAADVTQAIMESALLRVAAPQPTGIYLIAQERIRQVTVEGWDTEHDAQHTDGSLAHAGATYAAYAGDQAQQESLRMTPSGAIPISWPWAPRWWKPKSALRNLARAGALIAAEMDRRLALGEKP